MVEKTKQKKSESLEEELEKVIEIFDFRNKIGKEIYLDMNDGHTYVGTLLGMAENRLYLKNAYLPDTVRGLKPYIEIWTDNISAQLYCEE